MLSWKCTNNIRLWDKKYEFFYSEFRNYLQVLSHEMIKLVKTSRYYWCLIVIKWLLWLRHMYVWPSVPVFITPVKLEIHKWYLCDKILILQFHGIISAVFITWNDQAKKRSSYDWCPIFMKWLLWLRHCDVLWINESVSHWLMAVSWPLILRLFHSTVGQNDVTICWSQYHSPLIHCIPEWRS